MKRKEFLGLSGLALLGTVCSGGAERSAGVTEEPKEVVMEEEKTKGKEHSVEVFIEERTKEFKYSEDCLCVRCGDMIKWRLLNKYHYGIVIKATVSPLDWSYKTTGPGMEIIARVKEDAVPGIYLYGFGAFSGKELLFDDPELIVRPPKGG